MQDEFSEIDNIKLAVCSWNMGGVKPYDQQDLRDWLLPGMSAAADQPDIFVVGIQHIIENKGTRMFNKKQDKERLTFMQNNIMSCLNTHARESAYTLVRQQDMHGLYILLIAKAEA